ncbi:MULTISPECIES: hypothetical protein [Bacteroidaceae]|jgi:hypothetical protein|uniref:Uncharacterized protein n=3 Tax=Bacteroides acidifaciens TaxID=85831 RepID=A0A4S2AJH3_9BACE|nr:MULTISPECIES: hypothetical protein [Bacteroidaceae]MCR1998548.1 hypothetical protein [Bacteroides acidifaciens]TGY00995.1 hypothetical protein E5356_14210 [Bacteroides acidifaciens]
MKPSSLWRNVWCFCTLEGNLSNLHTFLSDEITGRQIVGKKRKQKETANIRQLLQVSGPNADPQFVMTDSLGQLEGTDGMGNIGSSHCKFRVMKNDK